MAGPALVSAFSTFDANQGVTSGAIDQHSAGQVVIVEDIGLDSGEVAAVALRQFRFRPALRGGQAVPVWIVYKIRFEFQE